MSRFDRPLDVDLTDRLCNALDAMVYSIREVEERIEFHSDNELRYVITNPRKVARSFTRLEKEIRDFRYLYNI